MFTRVNIQDELLDILPCSNFNEVCSISKTYREPELLHCLWYKFRPLHSLPIVPSHINLITSDQVIPNDIADAPSYEETCDIRCHLYTCANLMNLPVRQVSIVLFREWHGGRSQVFEEISGHTSPSSGTAVSTVTSAPARVTAMEAARPPIPAPQSPTRSFFVDGS